MSSLTRDGAVGVVGLGVGFVFRDMRVLTAAALLICVDRVCGHCFMNLLVWGFICC